MDTKDEYSTSDVAMELAIAVSRLQARMKHEAGIAERGITASQLAMLKRLDTEGELSVSTLAAYEHVSQQAITQRLELLRSTGYVTQHADSKDRRRRLVGLTDEGHAFLAHVTASQTTWLAHAIEYAWMTASAGTSPLRPHWSNASPPRNRCRREATRDEDG